MRMQDERCNGEFGPYHDLVVDVLQLALSEGFLSKASVPPDDVLVIRSLNALPQLEPAYHDRTEETPLSWEDLLERLRGEYITPPVHILSDDLSARVVDRVWQITRGVETQLRQRLPWLPSDLRRLVQYLVADCALCRAERGATSEFWEKVLRCLRSGAVPVGWSGHWPGGKMVAYYPQSRDGASGS